MCPVGGGEVEAQGLCTGAVGGPGAGGTALVPGCGRLTLGSSLWSPA